MRDHHEVYKLYEKFKGHAIILWSKIVCFVIQTLLVKVHNTHLIACKIDITKKRINQFDQNLSVQPGAIQVETSCKPNCHCHTK